MKELRGILVLFILLVTLNVMADNYFRDGTEWTVKLASNIPGEEDRHNLIYYTLEQENEDWLTLYLRKSVNSEKRALTYIKSEGDKVYFKVSPESEDYYLMYDFTLLPGEGAIVWSPGWYLDIGELKPHYAECISVEPLDLNPEIEIMQIREYVDETQDEWMMDCRIWYRGIGASIGPEWNVWYLKAGGYVALSRVRSGGETIFDFKDYVEESGITDVSWAADNGDAEYYTLQGVKVSEPTKGIFIKIQDGKAEKVFIGQ